MAPEAGALLRQQRGAAGDSIRVMNLASRTTLTGRIGPDGQYEVATEAIGLLPEVDPMAGRRQPLRDLEPETAGRQIAFDVAPLPAVRADSAMMRQVFANLLGNAVTVTGSPIQGVVWAGTGAANLSTLPPLPGQIGRAHV